MGMVGVTGGNRMVVQDVNDVLLYLPRWYDKANSTSRSTANTGATVTDDPDLSGIPLEVGIFEILVLGYFALATTNTQKIQTQWGFTGTWGATALRRACGPGWGSVLGSDDTTINTRGYALTSSATYDTSVVAASAGFSERAVNVNVTVAGNLSFKWAQANASANNTTLQAGSCVRVTRRRS